jgi:hypothetical protein
LRKCIPFPRLGQRQEVGIRERLEVDGRGVLDGQGFIVVHCDFSCVYAKSIFLVTDAQ